MEALSKIAERSGLQAQQSSTENLSLARRSETSLPEGMGLALLTMMDEMQARYPNQTLLQGTVEMWLTEWEEMALRFGIEMFRDALSKAIREPGRRFYPAPEDIREQCSTLRREAREKEEQEKRNKQEAGWKAQWEREREEERINGKPEPTEQERRLDAILAEAKRKDEEQRKPHVPTLAETAAIVARRKGEAFNPEDWTDDAVIRRARERRSEEA